MLDPNPPPRVRGQTSGGGRQTFKLKIEDADVDMAAKRASLDRIVKRAEAEECGWGTTDEESQAIYAFYNLTICLLYTSPSPRDRTRSRMPSSA